MKCPIEGVVARSITRHSDNRGWLAELFRQDELPADLHPVMSYMSMTRPGVTRGPHEHSEQTDIFCFLGPSTFRLYLWDNRPASNAPRTPDFAADFGEGNPALVSVPPGVVHAYQNIGKVDGFVFNAPNRLFMGQGRKEPVDEVRYEGCPDSPFLFGE